MIYIVNMVTASPNCETPTPVPESQSLQAGSKSDTVNGKGFAKNLKDVEDDDLSQTQDRDTGEIGDEKKDNGKQSNSDILNAIYGIAGILEGFGSLSYQTDSTDIKETNIDPQGAAVQANQETLVSAAQAGKDQENGLSEQIAWMLQKQGTGGAPAQTQDEMLKTVGEYLDSLENTRKDATGQFTGVQADGAAINPEIILNAQNSEQNNINNAAIVQHGSGEEQAVLEKTDSETMDTKKNSTGDLGAVTVKSAEDALVSSPVKNAVKNDDTNKGSSAATLNSLSGGNNEKKDAKADSSNKDDLSGSGSKYSSKLNKVDESAKTASAGTAGIPNFKSEVNNVVQTDTKTAVTETRYTAGTMGENVVRIVDSIKTGVADGNYQFNIQLKPEFLGKVNITLSMKDDNLKVRIKTDDPTVKGLLSDQTASLQSLFKEKGITVTSIEITYDNPSMQYNDGQTFGQQNSGGNTGGNLNYQPAAEEESFDAVAEQYNSYTGDGNIELYA